MAKTHGFAVTGRSAAAFETVSAAGLVAAPAAATWSAVSQARRPLAGGG
jgi:hypothetical protein